MSVTPRLALHLLLLLLLTAGSARADIMERELATELGKASQAGVVRLEPAGKDGRVFGRVAVAMRGTTVGQRIDLGRLRLGDGAKGERLWVQGPTFQILGQPLGRGYLLAAEWLPDATAILPGFVEARALEPLLAGRPAPNVCATIWLRYPDAPGQDSVLRGLFEASTGRGEVTGEVLGRGARGASWFFGGGGTSERVEQVTVTINGIVQLSGLPSLVEREGCWQIETTATSPVARTPAALRAALPVDDFVARGKPGLTERQAIAVATREGGGFLGTWVRAERDGARWYVSARSKSDKAPVLYALDASTWGLLLKADNADAVTLEGKALKSDQGAVLLTTTGLRVRMDGLSAWPAELEGQVVSARGALRLVPAPRSGKSSAGTSPLVLVGPVFGR